MFKKKAQEGGGGAAILVSLIALSILVYLLFIPPAIRQSILDGSDYGNDSESGEVTAGGSVLLLENLGMVTEEGSSSFSHTISSLNLYVRTEGQLLENFGGIAIARSVFSEKLKSVPFFIKDLDNIDNVLLSFNVLTAEGDLIIRLNGEEILNKNVEGSIEPIFLRKSLLKEANLLEFDVTGPGILFFLKNDYELTGVELRADVTDISHKETSTLFYMDYDERAIMRRVELYFYPYCSADADTLTVKLNGVKVFSGLPNCGYVNRFEISPEQVVAGSNAIDFEIADGQYNIDRIRFDTELKNKKNPIYYFDLNEDQMYNLTNRGYDVYLQLKFTDEYESREGRIYINNNIKSFDTSDVKYITKISSFVDEDFNSVKIVPEGSYDISELKIWLKK